MESSAVANTQLYVIAAIPLHPRQSLFHRLWLELRKLQSIRSHLRPHPSLLSYPHPLQLAYPIPKPRPLPPLPPKPSAASITCLPYHINSLRTTTSLASPDPNPTPQALRTTILGSNPTICIRTFRLRQSTDVAGSSPSSSSHRHTATRRPSHRRRSRTTSSPSSSESWKVSSSRA